MLMNSRSVLLPYMAIMLVAQVMLMLLMEWLGLDMLGFWLVALFDATAMSLTAIITLAYFTGRDQNHVGVLRSGAQLKAGAIVFGTELLIMLLFPLADHGWPQALLDAVVLSAISGGLIYWQVLLPLQHCKETPSAEAPSSIVWGALFTYLSLMTCAGIILLSVYQQQLQRGYEQAGVAEMSYLDTIKQDLLASLHEAALDLSLLVGQAERLVTQTGPGFDEQQLAADYLTYLKVRRDYAMLRLIDSRGEERVRVERAQGRPVTIPAGQLQDQRSLDYFGKAMQAAEGEIYISGLELTIEHGQIEIPHNPVIRLAMPFFDGVGSRQGIVIVNLMAERLLTGLSKPRQPLLGQPMLLHSEGAWLYGVEEDRRWGSVLEDRRQHSFANSHPAVWEQIQGRSDGIIQAPEGLYVYQKLSALYHPGLGTMTSDQAGLQPPHWWLISVIDSTVFEQDMARLRKLLLLVSLFFAVLTAIGVLLFGHTLRMRDQADRKLHQLANFDFLTGLANRAQFTRTLIGELERSRRSGVGSALFYMDLDNFKPINDRLGHDAGDAALKEVAQRLLHSVRPYDTVARLGGDEFAILMSGPFRPEDIEALARRILDAIEPPIEVAGQRCQLGISIGIALLHRGVDNHEQVLAAADSAMYSVKQAGKQGFLVAPLVPNSKCA